MLRALLEVEGSGGGRHLFDVNYRENFKSHISGPLSSDSDLSPLTNIFSPSSWHFGENAPNIHLYLLGQIELPVNGFSQEMAQDAKNENSKICLDSGLPENALSD